MAPEPKDLPGNLAPRGRLVVTDGMPDVVEKVDQLGFHGDANGSNRCGGWVYDHLRLLSALEVVFLPRMGRVEWPFVSVCEDFGLRGVSSG